MSTLAWIVTSGLAMSAIALVGSVTLLFDERTLDRLVLPLVAFAAGSLLGGAFFHMLPAAVTEAGYLTEAMAWLAAGFAVFFGLEQFLHWRHCDRPESDGMRPMTYLILLGDGLHNFMGGLAVAGAFILDTRVGMMTWLAAAAHEVPQELGDFGALVHGGWEKKRALLFNFLSAVTFLLGGLVAYAASFQIDVRFLLPFAAGNFIYIAASDLVPEVNRHHGLRRDFVHAAAFIGGLALLYVMARVL